MTALRLTLFILLGLPRTSIAAAPQTDDIVSLRIENHTASGPSHRYVLAYGSGATACQLLLTFDTTGRTAQGMPYQFVKASLSHHQGCHPHSLLKAVAEAHGLRETPRPGPRATTLTLDAALFGTQLARGDVTRDVIAGEFTTARPGTWTVLKLFFGDDEAEVFVALDPSSARADFLVKDPDYGQPLLRELGRVLWE